MLISTLGVDQSTLCSILYLSTQRCDRLNVPLPGDKGQINEAWHDSGINRTKKTTTYLRNGFCQKSDHFWLEIPGGVGWIKFEKLRIETEFTDDGALFVAKELRSGSDPAPESVVQARCVLWRQREALLSAANTLSFLLGQKCSG